MTAQKSKPTRLSQKLVLFSLIFMMLVLSIANIFIFATQKQTEIVVDTRKDTIELWQAFVKQNPTYRDGYLVLAQMYADINNVALAQTLVKQAFRVDPLSQKVIDSGAVLGVKSFE